MYQTPTLVLKPGKEKSLLRGHPWIFSGAVAEVKGQVHAGTTVQIVSSEGAFLAWAGASPRSQIRARVWSFNADTVIDAAFFGERIHNALQLREPIARRSEAIRLVHAEADGLPGFVVDRLGPVLVVQVLSAAAEKHREVFIRELISHTGIEHVFERSDVDSRGLEGLESRVGALSSQAQAAIDSADQAHLKPLIIENQIKYLADVLGGHKTGFYVDQRENRALVSKYAFGRVLNCFSYTGGFSLAALRGGADEVVSVDSSEPALKTGEQQVELNGLPPHKATWIAADVFKQLRAFRAQEQRFDCIILDPPKFAPNAASVEKAARAYKDINLIAMQLLNPGGLLFTFSCSGAIDSDLFRKIVAGAAADAKADMLVIQSLGAGQDHPVLLNFPEGEYLKGLLLRKRSG